MAKIKNTFKIARADGKEIPVSFVHEGYFNKTSEQFFKEVPFFLKSLEFTFYKKIRSLKAEVDLDYDTDVALTVYMPDGTLYDFYIVNEIGSNQNIKYKIKPKMVSRVTLKFSDELAEIIMDEYFEYCYKHNSTALLTFYLMSYVKERLKDRTEELIALFEKTGNPDFLPEGISELFIF